MDKIRGFEVVKNEMRKNPEVIIELPRRNDIGSCGYDIKSPINTVIKPNEQLLIWSDIKAYMLIDEALEANTRSSNGTKKGVILSNIIGWIDSTYYENPDNDGNIGICLKNTGNEDFIINIGDKIAQVKFSKYLTVDNDNPINSKRIGGFGSSGK